MGVAGSQPLEVVLLADLAGVLVPRPTVHSCEGFAGAIPCGLVYIISKQSAAHHLKRFVGLKGFPHRLNTPQKVLKSVEGLHTGLASRLDIAFGQGYYKGRVAVSTDCLGEGLNKG